MLFYRAGQPCGALRAAVKVLAASVRIWACSAGALDPELAAQGRGARRCSPQPVNPRCVERWCSGDAAAAPLLAPHILISLPRAPLLPTHLHPTHPLTHIASLSTLPSLSPPCKFKHSRCWPRLLWPELPPCRRPFRSPLHSTRVFRAPRFPPAPPTPARPTLPVAFCY